MVREMLKKLHFLTVFALLVAGPNAPLSRVSMNKIGTLKEISSSHGQTRKAMVREMLKKLHFLTFFSL